MMVVVVVIMIVMISAVTTNNKDNNNSDDEGNISYDKNSGIHNSINDGRSTCANFIMTTTEDDDIDNHCHQHQRHHRHHNDNDDSNNGFDIITIIISRVLEIVAVYRSICAWLFLRGNES